MHRFRLPLALAAGAAFFAGAAEATTVFTFSGTFKPATTASFTQMLGSGSFDGSFTLAGTGFPTSGTTNFQAFTLNLRDSTGTVRLTLTKGQNGAAGYISPNYVQYYGGTIIYFYDTTTDYLQLVVPTGFGGTGAVLANGSSYAQIAPQNQATVAAGTVTALPDPTSWMTMTLGFGLVGAGLRRRAAAPGTVAAGA